MGSFDPERQKRIDSRIKVKDQREDRRSLEIKVSVAFNNAAAIVSNQDNHLKPPHEIAADVRELAQHLYEDHRDFLYGILRDQEESEKQKQEAQRKEIIEDIRDEVQMILSASSREKLDEIGETLKNSTDKFTPEQLEYLRSLYQSRSDEIK